MRLKTNDGNIIFRNILGRDPEGKDIEEGNACTYHSEKDPCKELLC